MKKIIYRNRVIALALFTVFSLSATAPIYAGEGEKGIPVELKFLGNIRNQSLFELRFAGSQELSDLTIIIRDEYGNTLYRENIKSERFSKKFLINHEELEDNKLLFHVITRNPNKSVVYEINRQSKWEESTLVSQLK